MNRTLCRLRRTVGNLVAEDRPGFKRVDVVARPLRRRVLAEVASGSAPGCRPAPGEYRSITSATRMRMQPCEARLPIEYSCEVPWMPTPPAIPIQRARSGFARRAAGRRRPGELAGPRRVRRGPGRVDLLVGDLEAAGRRRVGRLADGDAVALGELQPLEQPQLEVGAVDRDDGAGRRARARSRGHARLERSCGRGRMMCGAARVGRAWHDRGAQRLDVERAAGHATCGGRCGAA